MTTYQNVLNNVIKLCEEYNIELVCAIIPTVPNVNNEAKKTYLLSKGVRTINWYDAVGTSASGQWYAGMLASDNVHPTEQGAKALAMQTLVDAPEIMQY